MLHPALGVDLSLYLKAVEKYIANEHSDFYNKIDKKLFIGEEYQSTSAKEASDNMEGMNNRASKIQKLYNELRKLILLNNDRNSKGREIEKITEEINDLEIDEKNLKIKIDLDNTKDLPWWHFLLPTFLIGNNKIVELIRTLSLKRRHFANEKQFIFKQKRDELLKAVKDEYFAQYPLERTGFNAIGKLGFSYNKFYSFCYAEKNGIISFVTPSDDKWNTLTPAQKEFIKFIKKIGRAHV